MLPEPYATLLPILLVGGGQVLVWSSTWQLGITGTFLGDYFGILMDNRVTSFPFNIIENPMYIGSTLSFVGVALWYECSSYSWPSLTLARHERPAGLFITAYVYIAYKIALRYEG